MDNVQKKREQIISQILNELEKEPLELNFSSPHIKGARLFVVMKDAPEDPQPFPDNETVPEDAPLQEEESYMIASDKADEDNEELSPKQLAKLEKAQEKERKRNEKAYNKMRADIQKRGFGTGVLKKLDDPADIYGMSDEDIRQIEVAGIINEDGYYTFTYPEDYGNIEKKKMPKKTILLIAGFAVAVLVLTVVLINNILEFF